MATICNSAVGINKGAKVGFTVNTWFCTPVLMTPAYREKKKNIRDTPVGSWQFLNMSTTAAH